MSIAKTALRSWRRAPVPAHRRAAHGAAGAAGDRGQITVFAVVVMTALLVIAGLVYDGGEALAAETTAIGEAQEAARAAAEQIDLATFRATGKIVLDPGRARAAALRYVAAAGTGDTVTVTVTAGTVTVSVTHTQATVFLRLAGAGALHVSGSATATAEFGVTGPGVR